MRRVLAPLAFFLALVAGAGTSMALDAPKGPVILTVTGAISLTNADRAAVFDKAMLEALPRRVTATETPWLKGSVRFEGPLGSALLDAVGARGTVMKVTALNDYSAEIPIDDFRKWPVILATRRDGVDMAVRDKGPIFIVYPFDLDKALYNERIFNRSVWQVKSIEVR